MTRQIILTNAHIFVPVDTRFISKAKFSLSVIVISYLVFVFVFALGRFIVVGTSYLAVALSYNCNYKIIYNVQYTLRTAPVVRSCTRQDIPRSRHLKDKSPQLLIRRYTFTLFNGMAIGGASFFLHLKWNL